MSRTRDYTGTFIQEELRVAFIEIYYGKFPPAHGVMHRDSLTVSTSILAQRGGRSISVSGKVFLY